MRPAKTQISLGIRPVWSESSLCNQWVAKGPSFLHADSEDSGCPGWSESSLGPHAILLVLSWGGSYAHSILCVSDVFCVSAFKTTCLAFTIEPRHDKTNKMSVRPAKTQISLGIRPAWSKPSLSARRKLGSLANHWAHSKDSDQTGRMLRLIWVFAWRTIILLVLSRRGSFPYAGIHSAQINISPTLDRFPFHVITTANKWDFKLYIIAVSGNWKTGKRLIRAINFVTCPTSCLQARSLLQGLDILVVSIVVYVTGWRTNALKSSGHYCQDHSKL